MDIKIFSNIDGLDARQWNAMVRGRYPFLRHEWLSALERHGCVGEAAGWVPRHLGCFDGDQLVGAMPLYEKHNSWGEFVFDHAWAEAFHRAGLAYYPKLLNAIPFTPASGPRILARDDGDDGARVVRALLRGAREVLRIGEYSGLHSLFIADEQFDLLHDDADANVFVRSDCQFHWHNRDYDDFEQFLATLKAKKRKNIRHERARAAASGVALHRLDGTSASERDWRDFSALYRGIYQRKYGKPAFTCAFFIEAASALGEQMQLIVARRGGDGEAVAAALMYLDDHALYGRHWGCSEMIDCLHFEACYYQGIEICIERGLRRFDPGAQGEHKIARGFAPVRTRSLHWMARSPFSRAIEKFVQHEKSGVKQYINAVQRHSPYHQKCAMSEA